MSDGKRIGGACLWCLVIAILSSLRTGDTAIIGWSEAYVSVGRCLLFPEWAGPRVLVVLSAFGLRPREGSRRGRRFFLSGK